VTFPKIIPKTIHQPPPHRIYINSPTGTPHNYNWKESFLRIPENSWFVDIEPEYVDDPFNVYGLQTKISNFSICADIISGKTKKETIDPTILKEVERNLPIAYGLIHARYITSPNGLDKLNEKYTKRIFGTCPRYYCKNEPLLPIGKSSDYGVGMVKVFCPQCRKIYDPRPLSYLDGSFWGPNAVHILIDHMDLMDRSLNTKKYKLEAFGFAVYDKRSGK
jgi:casein kinase II subunit beta